MIFDNLDKLYPGCPREVYFCNPVYTYSNTILAYWRKWKYDDTHVSYWHIRLNPVRNLHLGNLFYTNKHPDSRIYLHSSKVIHKWLQLLNVD